MSVQEHGRINNVSVVCKANVYFDGKVISHTVLHPNGDKQTLGLIQPGEFRFGTELPERMDIIAGACRVRLADADGWTAYGPGAVFHVPAHSHFDIAVDEGLCEYLCSFG